MEDVFKTLNLSDDNEIFRGYTTMTELYNPLKFITMLFFIQKILTFNLGVPFLKFVSIIYCFYSQPSFLVGRNDIVYCRKTVCSLVWRHC